MHHSLACGAGQRHVVDERAVQVVRGGQTDVLGAARAELLIAVGTDPDGKRRSPVPAARQVPVDQALEPVAHPAVADVGRLPVHAAVVGKETILDGGGPDEPRRQGVVQQRCVATPAERIRVQDPLGAVQIPLLPQILDDLRVGVLDEQAAVACLPVEEPAVEADNVPDRDPHPLAQLEVGDAVRGRGVHDAGALLHAHQLGRIHHDKRKPVGNKVGEQRLVGQVDEIRTIHLVENLVLAVEHGKPFFRKDVQLVALGDPDIRLARVDRQRHVPREGPWRRRPREQKRRAVGVVEPELHVHGRIRRVLLIPQAQLVRRQGRLASRTVRRHLVALIEQLGVPEGSQTPPDRTRYRCRHTCGRDDRNRARSQDARSSRATDRCIRSPTPCNAR